MEKTELRKIALQSFMGGLSPSLYLSAEDQYQAGSGIDPIKEPGILRAGPAENISGLNPSGINALISKVVVPGVSGDEQFAYGYITGAAASTLFCRIDLFNLASTVNASFVDGALVIDSTVNSGDVGGVGVFQGKVYFAADGTYIGSFTPGATPTAAIHTLAGLSARTYSPFHSFNNSLYIGNLNTLYVYDGTTTNASAFDIETGYEIDHIVDYNNYLVFTASRFAGGPTENITSTTYAFFWDTTSPRALQIVAIQGETRVRGLKSFKGILYLLGSNALYRFNGSAFEPVVSFSVGGYTGNSNITLSSSVEVEGLATWKNYVVWAGTNEVFFYGSPDPRIPPGIYSPLKFSTGTPVFVLGEKDSLLLVTGTSTNRVVIFETGGMAGASCDTKRINFGNKVKIKGIRIRNKALASTESISVSYRYRAGTGEGAVNFGAYTQAADGSVSEKFLDPDSQPVIDHCYLRIVFNGGGEQIITALSYLFYEIVPDEPYRTITPT